MGRFLWIGLAGALGTWCRYLVGIGAGRLLGTAFPYGTLVVNLAGCFLMGVAMHVALTSPAVSVTTRFALTTGFLGGFTTYSAFNYETSSLLRDQAWGAGLVNLALTVIGGFVAGHLGLALARRLVGG